jgi:hypothetical protein
MVRIRILLKIHLHVKDVLSQASGFLFVFLRSVRGWLCVCVCVTQTVDVIVPSKGCFLSLVSLIDYLYISVHSSLFFSISFILSIFLSPKFITKLYCGLL